MKFIIVVSFIFLFLSCSQRQSSKPQVMSAQVTFADTLFNVGRLSNDTLLRKFDFLFTNTGDVPVVILHTTPSCKCTSVEFSKEPVMSGKDGKITVLLNVKELPVGYFNKSVRIRFNSSHNYELQIRGEKL